MLPVPGSAATSHGSALALIPDLNSVVEPLGVILPIDSAPKSANHRLVPSDVMPRGAPECPVGNSVMSPVGAEAGGATGAVDPVSRSAAPRPMTFKPPLIRRA